MPINIDWQPPLGAVADASYQGGLGEYLNRQQQVALQQQQQALQNQHFQQQLAANLYSQQQNQMANQASQVFHAQQTQQLRAQDWEAQHGRDLMQRDWNTQDKDDQRLNHVTDLNWQANQAKVARDAQQQAAQEQFQRQQQAAWENKSVEESENSIDQTMKHVADNIDLLPQEAQKEFYSNLYSPWQAIKADRSVKARPQAYGEVLTKFGQDIQKSGILQRMKPRLNTAEQFQQETVPVPGIGVVSRDRSGAWRKIADEKDPVGDFLSKNLRYFQDPDTMEVNMDAAMDAAHKFVAAKQGMQAGQPPAQQAAQPDVWDHFKGHFPEAAAHMEAVHGGKPPLNAEQQRGLRESMDRHVKEVSQQQGQQPPSLTPGQQKEINRLQQQGQPPTPDQVAFQQQMAAHGRQQAQEAGQIFAAPPGGKVLKADSLPAAVQSQLPRLHSKEEVAAFRAHHGPGAPFQGPDGKVYKTN